MIYRVVIGFLAALALYLMYQRTTDLQSEVDRVTQKLEQEVRQRERVEQITISLQKAAEDRRKALGEYERELAKESSSVLSDTVPDSVLRGLRSVKTDPPAD